MRHSQYLSTRRMTTPYIPLTLNRFYRNLVKQIMFAINGNYVITYPTWRSQGFARWFWPTHVCSARLAGRPGGCAAGRLASRLASRLAGQQPLSVRPRAALLRSMDRIPLDRISRSMDRVPRLPAYDGPRTAS